MVEILQAEKFIEDIDEVGLYFFSRSKISKIPIRDLHIGLQIKQQSNPEKSSNFVPSGSLGDQTSQR